MIGNGTGKRARLGFAAALGLGTAVLAMPAQAQFFGWDNGGGWGGGLPGPQVRRSLIAQGFEVLGPLRRNGDVFVADVIDRRGHHERLIVGSADAQILQRFYVDDGRAPGRFARGVEPDEDGGLVPPADIPGVPRAPMEQPRRIAPPADAFAPSRRAIAPDAPNTAAVEPPQVRSQPPIRTVRPAPQVVERVPEMPQRREPGAVESAPLAPVAPKPRAVEPRVAEPPAKAAAPKAPAAVASRPETPPAAATPSTPGGAAPTRRMTDPLAIPGGPAKAADSAPPVRSVSGGITGAPPPAAAQPPAPAAKAADVPAAPLD